MNIKLNNKIKLLVVFIVLFTFILYFNKQRLDYEINHELNTNIEKIRINLNSSLYYFETATKNIEHYISTNEEILGILTKAMDSLEGEKDILRKQLYEKLKLPYKRIRNFGGFHFHFVTPDNKSFLRMHMPKKYGDELSSLRETYNYVQKYKKPKYAFENGKVLHAFRYVYPIFNKDKNYIGLFDISYDIHSIQQNLSTINKIHNHFIIKKELFFKHEFSDDEVLKSYVKSLENENYLFNKKDHPSYDESNSWEVKILELKKEIIDANFKKKKEFSLYEHMDGKVYTITFLPVNNIKGENCAYIVTYEENKYILNLLENYKYVNIISFISLAILFLFIYYLSTQKSLLKEEVKRQTKDLQKSADIISRFVIYSKTDKYGVITEVSEAFCDISGFSKDELLGKHHNMVKHPDFNNHPMFKGMYKALRNNQMWRGEFKNITKDGKTYWLDTIISSEYNDDNTLKGYTAFRYNITNKKALEEVNNNLEDIIIKEVAKNEKQKEIILKQEKIVALGNMMDAIAHQWKQPISIIALNLEGLKIKYELIGELTNEDIDIAIEDSTKQIKHLSTTIDEFRSFFRPNQKLSLVNIKGLLRSSLDLIKNDLIKYNIKTLIQSDEIQIECLPNELKHVFINLVNNSKDAFVENSIENRLVIFNITQDENNTTIKVIDNAGGIPKKLLKNIFESNFTTKQEGKGTGIGLYLVSQIIDKIDGKIDVYNIDDGVCFEIVLKTKHSQE